MRAPISNAVILAQQTYNEVPNLMEKTSNENSERYCQLQTRARKLLNEHPTRAEFDIKKYHFYAAQQGEKRDKMRHKEDKLL